MGLPGLRTPGKNNFRREWGKYPAGSRSLGKQGMCWDQGKEAPQVSSALKVLLSSEKTPGKKRDVRAGAAKGSEL